MDQIIITNTADRVMKEDALNSFPNECCGFVFGTIDGNVRKATLAQPVDNSKAGDQKRRFEIAPFTYMKAEQYALEHNLTLLGVYHSHPNHPALPSIHDLKQALPFFSYLIVSVNGSAIRDVRSWRLEEKKAVFEEEQVVHSAKAFFADPHKATGILA